MECSRITAVATKFVVPLISQAARPSYKDNPTLAAGDVKIVRHTGGTWNVANITTLPTAVSGATRQVLVSLSATEMTSDDLEYPIIVQFVDASGAEWDDQEIVIWTKAAPANMIQIDGSATSGNNATLNLKQLNIVNSAGTAIIASSTGSNGKGLAVSGNGSGAAASFTGGATGDGIDIGAGGTSGYGLYVSGTGNGFDGAYITGAGTGNGLNCTSSGSGSGIKAYSATGIAFLISAAGSAAALSVTSATGNGMSVTGGATSGNCFGLLVTGGGSGSGASFLSGTGSTGYGMYIASQATNGIGLVVYGTGTGDGVNLNSGNGATGNALTLTANSTNGNGISTTGKGSGSGLLATGGNVSGGGNGIKAVGAGTSSNGIYAVGAGTGSGFRGDGGGSGGAGVFAVATANGDGIYAAGQGTGHGLRIESTSGNGVYCQSVNAESIKLVTAAAANSVVTLLHNGTNGSALELIGAGTGHGLIATGGATGNGLVALKGASGTYGIQAVEIQAIKTKTDSLTFTVANKVDTNVTTWKGVTAPAMTGDAFARIGAPAGASVSADIAAVKVDTAAIKVKTDQFVFTVANRVDATSTASGTYDVNVINWKGSTAPAMTGDAFARLGAPSGASTAADIAAIFARIGAPSGLSIAADIIADAARVWAYGSGRAITDKAGFSLSGTQAFNLTGNITGNLSGSVGSVTGAVGSVTGAVGSVTGSVGSVTGAVGSVTAAVTVGTISTDAISALSIAAAAVTKIQSGLATATALSTTDGKVDGIKAKTDQLIFTGAYLNSQIKAIDTDAVSAGAVSAAAVTKIQSGLATATALGTVDTVVDAIKAKTDQLIFTGAFLNSQVKAMDTDSLSALAVSSGAVTKIQSGSASSADVTAIKAVTDQITFTGGAVDANVEALATDAISALSVSSGAVTKIQNGLANAADILGINDKLDAEYVAIGEVDNNVSSVGANVSTVVSALPDGGAKISKMSLADNIDGIPVSQVLELVSCMVENRFKKDFPTTGDVTFYKRNGVDILFSVHVTETERTRY